MLLEINPDNPQPRLISKVVETLKNGGVVAYPTDTTYGIGCSIFSKKGIERIYLLKQRERKKPFSFICSDLSDIARYAKVSNYAFKLLRRLLPGAYTFVLEANSVVPDLLLTKQRTVGIRIPDAPIALALVEALGRPLATTSAQLPGSEMEVPIDAGEVQEQLGHAIDLILDGGATLNEPSTVLDLCGPVPVILRQGKGKFEEQS